MTLKEFSSKMLENEWKFDEDAECGCTYIRGSYVVYVDYEDIVDICDLSFPVFFKQLTRAYHFPDDWKKDVDSIDVVFIEEEMERRKRMIYQQFLIDLMLIKRGEIDISSVDKKYRDYMEKV